MQSDNHSAAYQETVLMKEYWSKFKLLCLKTNFYFDSDDYGVKGRCSRVPTAGRIENRKCNVSEPMVATKKHLYQQVE